MLKLGLLILFVIVLVVPYTRSLLFNPHFVLYYSVRDIYEYFAYRLYNKAKTGKLDCYVAPFGGGKTLSMAQYIHKFNKRYNGKTYYDSSRETFVTQRVIVLSNFVVNGVDCVPLRTLQDVVEFTQNQPKFDAENNTRTVLLVAIDEASCQLNSRNFAKNIDALFLNTLITCRHYNINFIYSSQKFNLTDKLLRDVTQRVIVCKKVWRVVSLKYYDATLVENEGMTETLKPLRSSSWFCRNMHFKLYDTLACVDNMTKDDSRLDYSDILARISSEPTEVTDNHRFRRYRSKK